MPLISLIIPTLNEADNLPPLFARISSALNGRDWEAIVVDDASVDQTQAICLELSKKYPLKLLTRPYASNGLSGAVLHGIAQAQGEFLVVMDADLQHPPERILALLEPLQKNQADFVVGSRYVEGGSMAERFGPGRRFLSRFATLLASPFAGRVRDPMSGFFALRRQTCQSAKRLTPIGYKIGLELMCKCQVTSVREVPIQFAARTHGESKLTFKEQYRYLAHLSRLYDYQFPRTSPILKFLIVLAISWLWAAPLYLILSKAGFRTFQSAVAAYPLAALITSLFHYRYTRTQRAFLTTKTPWRDFFFVSLFEWCACALGALWTAGRIHNASRLDVFIISFSAAAAARYLLRKELLLDVRGIRKEIHRDELAA
ncbi:MAG TPA: polyprenol monophosphomannose synthase [Tepidisphaeraceae bacterium]|jgi:dolichol-phosphate mannosyltransferase|nr:polyprenol monophosphomannose synthase [Tepidisphaeraceae bacterium]